MIHLSRREVVAGLMLAASTRSSSASDETPGITDKEVKIGETVPFSGPASAYGVVGRAHEAFLTMINERGGINGRMIKLICLDDAYSPPKTVEQTRKLVEQEEVAAIFGSLGTPTNLATRKYLNSKGVPSILLTAGATTFNDPAQYPWTMPWQPNYFDEGATYAKRIISDKPDAKIALMYANDDSGKDYATGFKAGLGDKIERLVAQATYDTSEPTVTSQLARLKSSDAAAFFFHATPKFGAQIIRGIYEMGWKPTTYVAQTASSVAGVLEPAGYEAAQGVISTAYLKDASDPQWAEDQEMKDWRAWMARYNTQGDLNDYLNIYAYAQAWCLVKILERAGRDLTRKSIMASAASVDFQVPMLLPGIKLETSKTDYRLIKTLRLMKFEGKRWVLLQE
ncbi:ABC transporter substrate-binding protein [Bradyrhizobium sp. CCGUVB23]|uniref:ABC transporter substrate-binding protein n=1 Tax=Bradyrhizobium sp. CCGUVB23 TaxID=2949630 RepID=UPI0020B2AC39|nr:ABC transporter substrate-binding protein [Bradyrhizobium sp. CCGUVB23]MCP3468209.1 ABC transporter substrate-binding protein [Bradyrhizobium sp. CCGUVB23]